MWALITDVPKLKTPWQYVCFLLNVIIPGSGTMIASCFGEKWSKTLFLVGLFHLFLAYILIGWVFSIYWGYLIIRKSTEDEKELKQFIDKTNPRSDQKIVIGGGGPVSGGGPSFGAPGGMGRRSEDSESDFGDRPGQNQQYRAGGRF